MLRLASAMHLRKTCNSSLQFFLVYNRNAPCSTSGTLCHGSSCSASWANHAFHSHHWSRQHNPSTTPTTSAATPAAMRFSQDIQSFCSSSTSMLQQVSDSQWQGGEIQLHLDLGLSSKESSLWSGSALLLSPGSLLLCCSECICWDAVLFWFYLRSPYLRTQSLNFSERKKENPATETTPNPSTYGNQLKSIIAMVGTTNGHRTMGVREEEERR